MDHQKPVTHYSHLNGVVGRKELTVSEAEQVLKSLGYDIGIIPNKDGTNSSERKREDTLNAGDIR